MGHRQQTHCKSGHPFVPENTRWVARKARGRRKAGVFRVCRTCHNEATKFRDVFKRKGPHRKKREESNGQPPADTL